MVSPTALASAKSASAVKSIASIATFLTPGSVAVPALPGATKTVSTRVDWATFQASACSRPPLPMINTFILSVPFFKSSPSRTVQRVSGECETRRKQPDKRSVHVST
jgi:hypothetical protein